MLYSLHCNKPANYAIILVKSRINVVTLGLFWS